AYRDSRNQEFVGGLRRWWQRCRIELGGKVLRRFQMPNQEMAPDLKISCMCSVQPVAVFFERRPRTVESLRRPAQVARGKRDFGFGDDAPRACQRLFGTEGACRSSQQFLCSREIAELRHRDASKRE